MLLTCLTVLATLAGADSIRKESQFDSSREMSLTAGPVVQEDLGVVLQPGKILATSESTIAQSIFFNLRKPRSPQRPCKVDCAPNVERLSRVIPPIEVSPTSCWIPKMRVPMNSVRKSLKRDTLTLCLVECLHDTLCECLTYDSSVAECTLQNKMYYHPEDRVESLNSATSTLDCLLAHMGMNRYTACGIEQNPLFDTLMTEIKNTRSDIERAHTERFRDLKSAFDIAWKVTVDKTNSSNHRQKRFGWSDFDFIEEIPVVNYFYQILKSPSDNKKVREHVNKLQGAFEQFASDSIDTMENLRRFDQEILKIMDFEIEKVYDTMNSMRCEIMSVASVLMQVQTDKRYEQKLDALFYGSRHGRLVTPVATTLTLGDLQLVVEKNKAFKNTLYQGRPELLFRVADLMLVDVTNGETGMLMHYVLVAPRLTEGSLFRTYVPKTVPISRGTEEKACYRVETPDLVILEDGMVKTVRVNDCLEKDDVIYCAERMQDKFSPFKQIWPCFEENPETLDSGCTLIPTTCDTKMLLTKGGAMVFSQDEITAMKVSEDVHLSIISIPGKTNYFLEWDVYKHVQASRMVMYAPDGSETATVLNWKSPDTGKNLRKWLEDTQLVRERENITRLETMINQTAQLALSDYEIGYLGLNTSKKSFFEKLAWFSLGFTIFVVLQCIKRGIVVRQITNLTQTLSHLTMDRERTRQCNPLLASLKIHPNPIKVIFRTPLHLTSKNVMKKNQSI